MALHQLDTENADRNITSLITVLTDTPAISGMCVGLIKLGDGVKNLSGVGGVFQLVITVGGQTVQPSPQLMTFSTAVRTMVWTTPFPVVAGDEVIIRVLSPNGADTDVDCTAYLFDTVFALPNALPDAAGGLPISDTGGLDLDAILADTSELQANQGNWLTAVGFAFPGDEMDLVNAPNNTALVAMKAALEIAGGTLATLLTRIVGVLLAGNHSPQSGDSYTLANGAHGFVSIQDDIDTLLTRIVGTLLAGDHPVSDAAGVAAALHAATNALINALNDISVADLNAATPTANLSAAAIDAIANEPYDNDGVDISLREAVRIFLSVLSGRSTGGGTNTLSFRDLLNTKNRVRVTVDANGNRVAIITRDGA